MRSRKAISAYFTLAVILFAESVNAQIPVEKEPHHKVVSENKYLRVIDLTIDNSDTTLVHTHSAESAVVFLSKSKLGIQNVGQAPAITQVNPGDIVYRNYGEKPVSHTVWKEGPMNFRCIVIEFPKGYLAKDTCSRLSIPGVHFKWQQKLVRAYQLEIGKVENITIRGRNCSYFLIEISGHANVTSGKMQSLEVGEYIFIPPTNGAEINIAGSKNSSCVLLELR